MASECHRPGQGCWACVPGCSPRGGREECRYSVSTSACGTRGACWTCPGHSQAGWALYWGLVTLGQGAFLGPVSLGAVMEGFSCLQHSWVVVGPRDLPTAGRGPAGVPAMVPCRRRAGLLKCECHALPPA